jgi:hypothetical protein
MQSKSFFRLDTFIALTLSRLNIRADTDRRDAQSKCSKTDSRFAIIFLFCFDVKRGALRKRQYEACLP